MTDHSELIARLEAASEGSRELDAAIWYAVIETHGGKADRDMIGRWPAYTTSLDAIVALILRTVPASSKADHNKPEIRLTICDDHAVAWIEPDTFTGEGVSSGSGATPALALCCACLRALQSQEPGHGG